MGRSCTVCTHPDRLDIEKSHLSGLSYRSIADRYGLNHHAIARHLKTHSATKVTKDDTEVAETMVGRLKGLVQQALDVIGLQLAEALANGGAGGLGAINALKGYLQAFMELIKAQEDKQATSTDTAWTRYLALHPEARREYLAWYRQESRGVRIAAQAELTQTALRGAIVGRSSADGAPVVPTDA